MADLSIKEPELKAEVDADIDRIYVPNNPAGREFLRRKLGKEIFRHRVCRSLGCEVIGAAKPCPDRRSLSNAVHAFYYRMARKPAVAHKKELRKFRRWVRRFVRRFDALDPDHSFDFEAWLEETSYPHWRKEELRKAWKQLNGGEISVNRALVKMFIKAETYPMYKPPRGIYARIDLAKVVLGPIFKSIEKVIYEKLGFIKKVAVKDRPDFIKEKIDKTGSVYWCTDYSRFESTFVAQLMDICEFQLYDHMLKFHPIQRNNARIIRGENVITSKWFRAHVRACRMSGEMNTSLGNGFSNLCFLLYIAEQAGATIDPVVEGDDGLFSTSCCTQIDFGIFDRLGISAVVNRYTNFGEASFCGLRADPDSLENTTDVVGTLMDFGWTLSTQGLHAGPAKLRGLLKSKVLSLLYEYPRCPILWALCKSYSNILKGVEPWHGEYNWYTQWLITQTNDCREIEAGTGPPSPQTRVTFADFHGISVERQIEVEDYLLNLKEIRPFHNDPVSELVMEFCHPDCIDYFQKHYEVLPLGTPWVTPSL